MAEAYGNRGTIKLQMGETQSALSDFQKAAELFGEQQDHTSVEIMRGLIQEHTMQSQ